MNDIEIERRNRIRLTLAAYAYEFENESIMSDGEFDELAKKIRPEMSTIEGYHITKQIQRYRVLDKFFQTEFSPDTGQWIHKHPELQHLSWYYKKLRTSLLENNG